MNSGAGVNSCSGVTVLSWVVPILVVSPTSGALLEGAPLCLFVGGSCGSRDRLAVAVSTSGARGNGSIRTKGLRFGLGVPVEVCSSIVAVRSLGGVFVWHVTCGPSWDPSDLSVSG